MSNCYSDDGTVLATWALKDVEMIWNDYFSKKFGWRSYNLGKIGSKSKAAFRLSQTLRQNAQWLDCSAKSDIDDLFGQFQGYLIGASGYLDRVGVEEISNIMGQQVTIKMTFWSFIRPGLRHLHTMSQLALGNDPDQALARDLDRRKSKGALLKEFGQDCREYAKRFAYLAGSGEHSNEKLETALNICRQHIGTALDDLTWETDK